MIDRYTEADLTPPYGNGISESSANSVILPPTANESASPDKQYKQMSKKVNNKSKNKKTLSMNCLKRSAHSILCAD